jgi:tetratricopeptide (TPR) repeat protein
MPNVMPIHEVISRCERFRASGRFGESEELCRRALVQIATHPGILFQSAATAFAVANPRGAHNRFKRVRAILPGASGVHYNIGVCARRMGRHADATGHLRKALLLDPTADGAWDALAQSQSVLEISGTAMTAAQRQLVLRPMSPKALSTLGYVAWRANELDIAERALQASLMLDPAIRDAEINLGNVLTKSGRHAEAIHRYRRLSGLFPRDPSLFGNLGVALVDANDWRGASAVYHQYMRLTRGRPTNQSDKDPFPTLPVEPIARDDRATAWHRLKFDSAQLAYLLDRDAIPKDFENELAVYRQILTNLDEEKRTAISFDLTDNEMSGISRYHDRIVHLASTDWVHLDPSNPMSNQAALNPNVDWHGASAAYLESTPAVTVIDDFLDPRALSALRKFCLESTIWFELKGAGYLGAYFREGFNDPLLLAIAEQLSAKMPEIFAAHQLRMIWAYTYEQSMVGINPHADFARINVNFWITPNSANLDPDTGGVLIYRRPAPESWEFDKYNAAPGREIMDFLGEDAQDPIRVPHRQNRAVIFDSRLFHETDRLSFADGLENRRINITMLFGEQ